MFVGQSGLGLPDEGYYREDEYAEVREAYLGHIGRMLEIAEDLDAGEAEVVVNFLRRMGAAVDEIDAHAAAHDEPEK